MASLPIVAVGVLMVVLGVGGSANAYQAAQWHLYTQRNHPSSGYSIEEVKGVEPSDRQVRLARMGWGIVALAGMVVLGYGLA